MRKLIDERGRLFSIISIIDVAVFAVVLLLAAGFYMRFFMLEHTATPTVQTQKVTYTLKVEGIREPSVKVLREGDKLYANEDNEFIGTIVKVESKQAETLSTKSDGTYEVVPLDERYDILMTVEADGRVTNGKYYMNKTREINKNNSIGVYTKYVTFSARVMDIVQ